MRWKRWPEEWGAETVKARIAWPVVQIGGRLVTASSWETTLRLQRYCKERARWKRWPEERNAATKRMLGNRLLRHSPGKRELGVDVFVTPYAQGVSYSGIRTKGTDETGEWDKN
ncbi:hypothetical protein NDU88_002692 [Pleurodeles waltl]|uniref:Transposase n=1 Tax=Pleurodeles waltl TaxID=8319 RepID=A0AAV7SEE3_PLEWA|nr:hypothetical protein NDU88_002692 [Pleurodeles waltl]